MGLRPIYVGGGPAHPATPFDVTITEPTYGGHIVVAIGNRSGPRGAGPATADNYINGVSDSLGHTYTADGLDSYTLYYPVSGGPDGYEGANLGIFSAAGFLAVGDTVHIDAGDPDSDATDTEVIIFDAGTLGGAGTAYSDTYTYSGSPGTVVLSDADALGLALTADDTSHGILTVTWPNGTALALWEDGNTAGVVYSLATSGWEHEFVGLMFAAYQMLPTQFHLPVAVRAYEPDEDETVTV